jgi:myo-inositol-1(or 4)-monophosphatase
VTALAVELRDLAADIAREAGDMVTAGRRRDDLVTDTKSSATDMVTQFDRASEQLIVGRLAASRPNDGIVGEEGASSPGTSGITWLVDPIDGTTNFLFDLPGFAVSIAAADADGTLAGAVYVPRTGELFVAARGHGASLRDGHGEHALRCSSADQLGGALVATGFSYLPQRRTQQAQRLARLIHEVRDVRRFGAAAVDLCYVAAGRFDAYFEEHLGPWDLAAGELIAREAGARSGDFRGNVVRPDETLVAAPGVFDAMAALIRAAS